MFNERYNAGMEMFNIAHVLVMIAFILLLVPLFIFKNKIADSKRADFIFRMCIATMALVLEVTFHVWTYTTQGFDLIMLPFGLCAMTNILTIIALYGNFQKVFRITYYWALTGGILSILFVDMTYMPPHFRFFHFFIIHYYFIVAALYFVGSGKTKLRLRDLFISFGIVSVVGFSTFIAGFWIKTDWLFVRTSAVESISNIMGFPWYTMFWTFAVFLIFAIWHFSTVGILKLSNRKKRPHTN